jgi:arylsulfatase A-like enzyme
MAFFDSNGPLRGFKRDLYDGGIRVPMIACWPGTIAPGGTTDHPSAFWDWMPTACELAGVEPADRIDGVSYAPTLLGQPDKQKKHEYLYWSRGGIEAVRAGHWKAVRPGKGNAVQLYDLRSDIGEQHDLAGEHPDVLAKMTAMMKAARQ